ncbi:MAG: glycerol-3-phosphate 1-O-acyltransferase PlsY [Gammaproteobacteria bacterium]|nr:glycerol-3-phosphate 1-O-acyltransferase PlsY [Gammaproteobacteria bacterium]MDH4256529.1 glycerol-3-phosphate 1-O-acyltransferase PlsY [Gammaproteobacteria bacterium]
MLQCGHLQHKGPSMLELAVKFLIAYFIGSVMGAMVMGRIKGGVDIRTMGSGNAGGTNALRTQGWVFALGVVIVDVGKGYVAAGLVPGLELPFAATDPRISRAWLTISCAAAGVVGHVWPVWHGFRGGKGAATMVGSFLALSPWLVVPVILVWALVLTLSGYVGLSTMSAGIMAPVWVGLTRLPAEQPLFIYCVLLAAYLLYTHRSNIARMRAGTEARMTRVMIFGPRRAG